MKPSPRTFTLIAVLLAGGATLAAASRASAATTCNIDFGNYSALKAMPDNAAGNTFAVAPWYQHPCSNGTFTVSEGPESKYGHYHLSFENSCVKCFASNNYFGLDRACAGTGTGCAVIDPAAYPRYVAGHLPDEVFQMTGAPNPGTWCTGSGCLSTSGKVFKPLSIFARDTPPMKVIVIAFSTTTVSTPNGSIVVPIKVARTYDNLTGLSFWSIGNNQTSSDQILITKATGTNPGQTIQFDNILILQ